MRLRNIKGAREIVENNPYTIIEPKRKKGLWKECFHNTNPIHIEIGMGKGKFITQLSLEHKEINYIGIERYSSVLLRALEKLEEQDVSCIKNLMFIRMDAGEICDVFEQNEVDRIYLNFSDPWPKERHAKRRLTSRQFFERYRQILSPDGRVEFKTDNQELFEFSLEEIPAAGWKITEYTRDLHHDKKMEEGNIMTEYEEKFSSLGQPIYKLIAKMN